jgi:2-methylfumaryl-CoA isomerase
LITGKDDAPVNHVLPAWDLLAGMTAATALLAALRRRDETGSGGRIDIALNDVALAGTANLGWLSEASRSPERAPQGNDIYGTYGRDFGTADGRHVMVVALTPRQWSALVHVTGTAEQMRSIEGSHGVNLARDESARYRLRGEIGAVLEPWFAARSLEDVTEALDATGALWAPYRSLREAALKMDGPLRHLEQPGIGTVIAAESPIRWRDVASTSRPAPAPGADTRRMLAQFTAMTDAEIDMLSDHGGAQK